MIANNKVRTLLLHIIEYWNQIRPLAIKCEFTVARARPKVTHVIYVILHILSFSV